MSEKDEDEDDAVEDDVDDREDEVGALENVELNVEVAVEAIVLDINNVTCPSWLNRPEEALELILFPDFCLKN